jgi:sulfoxide reductase heme-binding subunit YedZ
MFLKRIKWAFLVGSLVPAGMLAVRIASHTAGDNPVEAITYETGDWTMILLLATLAITPLRRISGINEIISLRRTFGLLTFFYGSLHFFTYVCLAQSLQMQRILGDIRKRPFIALGLCAFLLMIPLAITSNGSSIRRLGRHWARLHQWIYAIAITAVMHYGWMRKSEAKPYLYALIFACLLGWRVRAWAAKRRKNVTTQSKTLLVDRN